MPPERYCAPASEPSASRMRLTRSWPRATPVLRPVDLLAQRSARSSAALYASVACSASS